MGISVYLKQIARGASGARALDRAQAADAFGQVLDGRCSDLEVGAFCIAMRVKGETPQELAGFLDALDARIHKLPASDHPMVVLPSYNGARKLPVLTPLLALMLARKGLPVLIHGTATEDARVTTAEVLALAGIHARPPSEAIRAGCLHFVPTEALHPGLERLLQVRRQIGVRSSAHSVVKLMNPVAGPALVVGSYTHTEFAHTMAATLALTGQHALLLRGTEGEPVADARRARRMDVFLHGRQHSTQEGTDGPFAAVPGLPAQVDAPGTFAYIRAVMEGDIPAPQPILAQVDLILHACKALEAEGDPSSLQALVA